MHRTGPLKGRRPPWRGPADPARAGSSPAAGWVWGSPAEETSGRSWAPNCGHHNIRTFHGRCYRCVRGSPGVSDLTQQHPNGWKPFSLGWTLLEWVWRVLSSMAPYLFKIALHLVEQGFPFNMGSWLGSGSGLGQRRVREVTHLCLLHLIFPHTAQLWPRGKSSCWYD